MLRAHRAKLARKLTAAKLVYLVRMYLQPKAHFPRGGEQPSAFFHAEHTRFKEHVAEFRQALALYFGQHIAYYKVYIFAAFPPVFFGYGVRAKVRNHSIHRMCFIQPFYDPKLLQLRFHVKPIAAFQLSGRNALRKHFVKEGAALFKKLLLACLSRCAHGGKYAAAGAQYVKIACAFKL